MRLADMGWFWNMRQGGEKERFTGERKRVQIIDREGSIRSCSTEKGRSIPKTEQERGKVKASHAKNGQRSCRWWLIFIVMLKDTSAPDYPFGGQTPVSLSLCQVHCRSLHTSEDKWVIFICDTNFCGRQMCHTWFWTEQISKVFFCFLLFPHVLLLQRIRNERWFP